MEFQSETEEKKILERIVAISEEFLQSVESTLNYQKITDNIFDISGAKYAAFNLYDEDGTKSRTVAFSAPEGIIKKASSLLDFKLLDKKWVLDPVFAEKIKANTITHFSTLTELVGGIIPTPLISLLEKTFNIGEVVLVKILKENVLIGNFTLIMPGNVKFKNDNYVEIYTRQVGLLVTRSRSEAKLIESEMRIRCVFAAVSDPLFLIDQKTGDILDVNEAACSLYGYTRDEMLQLKNIDMSAEPEKTRKALEESSTLVPVRYHKKKDGSVFIVEITVSLFELNGRKVSAVSIRDITERKKAEEALRKSEEKYRLLIENSHDIIYTIDPQGVFTFVSPAWTEILGHPLTHVVGKSFQQFVHPDDIARCLALMQKTIETGERQIGIEYRVQHADGSWRWHITNGVPLKNKAGTVTGFEGIARDITERKKAGELLEESKKTAERYLNVAAEIIISLNTLGNITLINDSGFQLLGYNYDELIGKNWFETCLPNKTASAVSSVFEKLMNEDIENVATYENTVRTKTGEIKTILWHNAIIKDLVGNITGTISSGEDITERKNTENKIIHLSYHNQLTGLYNRRFVEEEIKRLDTKRQLPLSVVMADLNSLKLTNDTFGHSEGDKLLKETAELLKKVCRSDDILARWGGDEFVILLPKTSTLDAEEIVQRIKKECSKLFIQKIPIGLATGIATKIEAKQDMQSILIEAESNMYKNKLSEKESNASSIIFALEQTLFEKSSETMEHAYRIKDLAIKLGNLVKLHPHQLDELSLLASLHDIGKVAIPETILLKEGKLTEKEWAVIKRHPEIGFNIAQASPQIIHIAKFILACHENWDGSGYPRGLVKESIPLLSRIMFIADAYDVMTSERIYKKAMSKADAIKELKKYAGTQFDPILVEKFIEILPNETVNF